MHTFKVRDCVPDIGHNSQWILYLLILDRIARCAV